jgi:hypothetical protein
MADYFFDFGAKKSPFARLDMSEFQSASDVYKLLGYGNTKKGIDLKFSNALLEFFGA